MKDNFGRDVPKPDAVGATMRFIELLRESPFEVMENFHPALDDSITLVDLDSNSAITLVIVESDDGQPIPEGQ